MGLGLLGHNHRKERHRLGRDHVCCFALPVDGELDVHDLAAVDKLARDVDHIRRPAVAVEPPQGDLHPRHAVGRDEYLLAGVFQSDLPESLGALLAPWPGARGSGATAGT